jgi:hypothetical protein
MSIYFLFTAIFCKLRGSIEFHEASSNVIVFFDRDYENSSITDLAAACCGDHDLHDVRNAIVIGDNLDQHIGNKLTSCIPRHDKLGDVPSDGHVLWLPIRSCPA